MTKRGRGREPAPAEGESAGPKPGSGGPLSGGRGTAPRLRAWAELLRLPALFTVPGDALAGAAAVGARPNSRTLLAIGSSLCLYEAGMALNDWADRAEDALERPHRPLPSGRVHPAAALTAAGVLTAAGLTLAARAGRPALTVAAPLAATVWAYDLALKRTPLGPTAMATARALDLLLGATATASATRRTVGATAAGTATAPATGTAAASATATSSQAARVPATGAHNVSALGGDRAAAPRIATHGPLRQALPRALALGAHTLAVTTVSRHETQGGSPSAPLAALATTGAVTWSLIHAQHTAERTTGPASTTATPSQATPTPGSARHAPGSAQPARGSAWPALGSPRSASGSARSAPGSARPASGSARPAPASTWPAPGPGRFTAADALRTALAAGYAATTARPLFHAALNPSPPLTQRAVGAGIRAMIPLQAALAARSGALATAVLTAALAPAARKFARKVSVT